MMLINSDQLRSHVKHEGHDYQTLDGSLQLLPCCIGYYKYRRDRGS